ncbi:MAG: tetratricopeptide repeat protein [Bacteroidales bacterium]|jgi:tetratricopeptide (TPR) repeat protein|nr:tetratricopeptide repeat protein [Bacteroidales bacterium]
MSKIKLFIIIAIIFSLCSCNQNSKTKTESLNDKKESITAINEKIRKNPKSANLFLQRAELYLQKNNIIEAINDMQIALKLDSLNENYYIKIAEYQMIKGDSEQGKQSLEKCLKINPKNDEAKLKLAYIYFYVQMYNKALFELEDIETLKKQSSESYFLKALIFDETEMYENAIEALKLSIEYDNENWKAYERIGLILAGVNNKLAVDYFETAIRLFPANLEIRYNAGVVFQKFELFEKAVSEYQFVISNEPNMPEAHENLGIIYVNNIKNYNLAIEEFSKTIEIDSLDHTAYYNRGYTYEKMKNYKLAEIDYRKTLKIVPNYELAIQGLNEILEK